VDILPQACKVQEYEQELISVLLEMEALSHCIRVNFDEWGIPSSLREMHAFLKKDFPGGELGGVSPRTPSYFFVSHTKK